MNIPIDGVTAALKNNIDQPYLAIHSTKPLYTLNSSIWRGGFGMNTGIVNRQVHKSYFCDNPEEEMYRFLRKSGEDPEKTTGMLTAAYVEDVGYSTSYLQVTPEQVLHVSSWVTVGLGNASRAGISENVDLLYPGTINIIVLIEGLLTDSAMVNAVITATEAKAAAMDDLKIKVREGNHIATGTTTDAVIIATTRRGENYAYAGTATKLGYLIGKTVYDAAKESTLRYLKLIQK
ncbi:MAG: hypothetical protein JWM44_2934 [Bacilli bacterium]|nr:hypothetical protein [Bacilli bacterium]